MNADPVLTLADLERWTFAGTALAVLGHPIGHSLSPPMHNAALRAAARRDARFSRWRYFRFDVEPAELPRALEAFAAARFRGINLTVPHKVLAVDLIDVVDPSARAIGAVNTLRRTRNGWRGFNTDGYGLEEAVVESLGLGLRGRAVVLVGAGGAARGAAVQCLASRCQSLWICNRTPENLAALLKTLRPLAGKIPLRGFSPEAIPEDLPAGALVINATSAGLKASDPLPLDLRRLPRPGAVYDMIYNPAQTRFLGVARSLKLPHSNGLGMLVHQGAKALELWTGIAADTTSPTMRRAARYALTHHR